MSYDVVLFDFDHTLLDSDASLAGAFEQSMRSAGVVDAAAIAGHYADFDRINQALWRQVEAQQISPNDVKVRRFEQLIEVLELDADAHEMADAFVEGLVACGELFDGAIDLLDDLAARSRLGMVTNGIGRVQRGRLARLGLSDHFDAVVISGEVGASKPGPAIFDVTFEAMGVSDRSSVLMVGDSLPSDILGAANAGIASAWFNPMGHQANPDIPATHEVRDLPEISPLV
ncbi:YjjG family noncanonical pyrimidine nucleotidase [Ilumatobacter coccineus]|uniref:Putative phosphatase n=1 Tax=Ilumatobacter coccineus (strain NBRC 103263 / KCTC 29153 / YM16-304) TaxID=1313172 RepID=A0A6C7E7V0_ILUCY|nr:YjjG family noncanonical pyrimidine nucleotidase [Ilumatobacter coccineus]BAN02443.1 putative phosphatase [Ilumatobacter coccineus YM16-304]